MYTLQVATLSPGQTIAAQLPLHSGDFGRSSGEVNAGPKQGVYIYVWDQVLVCLFLADELVHSPDGWRMQMNLISIVPFPRGLQESPTI
jgi:hypothetical protein